MADDSRNIHPRALPNYQRAVIPENKLLRYSLDPTHPRGRHKAIVFKSALGFDQSNLAPVEADHFRRRTLSPSNTG